MENSVLKFYNRRKEFIKFGGLYMKRVTKGLCALLVLAMVLSFLTITVHATAKPELNQTKATICVEQTTKLKVTNYASSKVTWTSSNKKVATVTANGTVKGVKTGTATITAKVGKKTVQATVTVAKHKWVEVAEVGHYEEVETGYKQHPRYSDDLVVSCPDTSLLGQHVTGNASYDIFPDPTPETQWVVDTEAYYQCARCNAIK
jgi:hypothetical protein